ncbi:hypothetical protein SAMN05421755_11158 [Nitrosomonas sp. Nm33]|nr:hypothetical protein SAMN05421755_11158 [Nitrosomonas sp. Nm33]
MLCRYRTLVCTGVPVTSPAIPEVVWVQIAPQHNLVNDTIEVESNTEQELENELQYVGFSAQAAKQIVAHA